MTRSSEKRYRRKPHAGKRRRDQESRHWLGEGSSGQESLLLDLDAYLYAADSFVSRLIVAAAHAYDGNEERPFALYMPASEQIGWHIPLFTKHFNLYVWSDPMVDQLQEATECFDAQLVSGELDPQISNYLDLFVAGQYAWLDKEDLFACIQEILPLLSPEGKAAVVLPAFGGESALQVVWADGASTPLSEVLEPASPAQSSASVYGRCCLTRSDPFEPERVQGFLKRNRLFFGRDARDLLLARLREPDIIELFRPDADPPIWSLVVVWESQADY